MSKITFIGEHRKLFATPNLEGDSELLGSFEAAEILKEQNWQSSDVVTVRLFVPYEFFTNVILAGDNPSEKEKGKRRARYFSFRDNNDELNVYFIQNYSIQNIHGSIAELSIKGGDIRIFADTMTSAPIGNGEDWVGTKTSIVNRLSRSLCNTPRDGMRPWQRLPITSLSGAPNVAGMEKEGWVTTESVEFGDIITIGAPDPLPIAGALKELYAYWPDIELAPWGDHTADGSITPWWRWRLRQRVARKAVFSENSGTLTINGTSGSNEFTETMAYLQGDYSKAKYAAGNEQGRVDLSGPWAGFNALSVSPPEGSDEDTFMASKALSGTLSQKRLTFDLTLNFTKMGIKPIIGMQTFARIGNAAYKINVDKIVSHYDSQRGWLVTAPVFVEQDTVKVASIKDGPYIEFEVSSNTTTFSIPVNNVDGVPYAWTIEVDGVFYGEYVGTSSASSAGIPLVFGATGVHNIRIYDTFGEYAIGWARPFGFYSNTTGANNNTNKAKLIRVIADSDWGHLINPDTIPTSFRRAQFYNCVNLQSSYIEGMPSTLVAAVNDCYYQQYWNCTKLSVASPESMGSGVLEIGANYRFEQYTRCTALSERAAEDCAEGLIKAGNNFKASQYKESGVTVAGAEKFYCTLSVGDSFRASQYQGTSLMSAGAEMFPSSAAITVGNGFRSSQFSATPLIYPAVEASMQCTVGDTYRSNQYSGCSNLLIAAEEKDNVTASAGYRSAQYSACSSIIATAQETTIKACTNNFRVSQYSGCVSLIEILPEVNPTSINVSSVTGWRQNQYSGCINLEMPGVAANFNYPLVTSLNSYKASQYSGCIMLKEPAVEVFNNNHLTMITSQYSGQYRNCSSLKRAAVENFVVTSNFNTSAFRISQYEGCTAITETALENFPYENNTFDQFRRAQYKNCSSLVIAHPAAPLLSQSAAVSLNSHYRAEQFMNCVSLENMQETQGTIAIFYSGANFAFSAQYENCVSMLQENPNLFEEFYISGYPTNHWGSGTSIPTQNFNLASRRYYGCESMRYALKENAHTGWLPYRGTLATQNRYKQQQYAFCTSLEYAAEETEVHIVESSANTSHVFGIEYYRTSQYEGCESLLNYTDELLETSYRDNPSAVVIRSTAFRSNQFMGTPATDVSGNRVKFKDGVEAIPGTNVPNNIY